MKGCKPIADCLSDASRSVNTILKLDKEPDESFSLAFIHIEQLIEWRNPEKENAEGDGDLCYD